MIGRIYIIKNTVNDKVYIGQTVNTIEYRFYCHKLCAKDNAKTKLYKAMYDLGKENFYVELLVECDVTSSELTLLEYNYILKYNSIEQGYNSILPVGNYYTYDKLEFISERTEEMINDYKSGMNYNQMCAKYNLCKQRISLLCSMFKDERKLEHCEYTNEKKPVIAYNKDFEPMHYFGSIREAFIYLSDKNNSVTKYGAYYYIKQSCILGNIAYGYRWQLVSDLIHKDKIFRTKFDKEAYLSGSRIIRMHNSIFLICGDAFSDIKGMHRNTCIDCGKLIKARNSRCLECYKKVKTEDKGYKCTICGKFRAYKENGLCNSCSNVVAKGKSPKPSKEELESLLKQGLQKKQIAEQYDRTPSTIQYWIKSYGIR